MASLLLISLFLAFSSSLVPSSSRKMEVGRKEVDNEPVLVQGHSTQSNGFDPSKVVQLSRHPRAFLYTGFLSHEECDHLISLARGKVEKSMVVDPQSGDNIIFPLRTSSGMFLHRGQDDIVERIEDKISTWTLLPKENGEPLQILHYEQNEKYNPHHDYLEEKSSLLSGGQRFASVLIYLSNVTQGGETVLLKSELKDTQLKDETWSPCARASYAVKPVKGNALLFFNLHVNLTKDARSLHGGCPVIEGEKWLASKWIHLRAYNEEQDLQSSGSECTDEDENCPQWAALGECKKNPVYMVGTPDYYGTCRKSCQVC